MSTGLRDAVAALDDARAKLITELAVLDLLPPEEQVLVAREIEAFRNRFVAVDLELLAGLDRANVADALCQGNLRQVLTSALSISKAEAARRVHAYETLGPRRSMLGEELDPIRPVLSEAVRAGDVSNEKAATISRGLASVDRVGFDPADIAAGEKILTAQAKLLGPEDIRHLTQRVVDAINPDGTKPKDQPQHDRRWFEMHPTKDGGFRGEFRLTGQCGAKLETLLRPLAKVRVDESGETDERTFGQRQHDALEELCNRLLREGTVRDNGSPVTVIITIDEEDLRNRSGHGRTTTGGLISADTLIGMASQADIYPVIRNAYGVVLEMGRTKRCATRGQTIALIARDIGCTFPGCQVAAEYCERHHIVPWSEGGLTDLNNLALLCIYHHHNVLNRGWQVSIGDRGLPEWLPPRWIDPDQRPRINTRIRVAHRLE